MDTVAIFRGAFAAAVVLATANLAMAALGRLPRAVLVATTAAIGLAASAAWVAFAVDPSGALAAAAGGLTASTLVASAAYGVERTLRHARRIDRELARAEERLQSVIEHETEARAAELERTLARARADTASLLAEEERRVADERRGLLAEREGELAQRLSEMLAKTQQRVEQRLAAWNEDLERAQAHLADELQRLGARQRRLIEEAEGRLGTDADRLESESETQRAALLRLREDLERAAAESVESARAELESHAIERRRALQELADRLRRRERELREQIGREETEAQQRFQASFGDIERRLVERLERVVTRNAQQFAEAAGLQFGEEIKRSREDAARRLSRELDRAVAAFVHEAETVLTERMTNVAESAAQRLDVRLTESAGGIEQRREELAERLERRVAEADEELRRRMDALVADAEAERAVLEARLHELARRIDQAHAHVQSADVP